VNDNPKEFAQAKKDSVLIVDDDAFMLKVLYRVLGKAYTIYQAESAESAADVLRAHPVKAILCDHVLPGQSGLDFLVGLQQRNAQIKSVLFSAALDTEPFKQALHLGQIFRFIKKPASPSDIQRAVQEAVQRYDSEATQRLPTGRSDTPAPPLSKKSALMLTLGAILLGVVLYVLLVR